MPQHRRVPQVRFRDAHIQLDLAQVPHPGKTFRGRDVLVPRGKSWTAWLAGQKAEVHDANAIHGWERRLVLHSLDSS
jgi:hypothetical protein